MHPFTDYNNEELKLCPPGEPCKKGGLSISTLPSSAIATICNSKPPGSYAEESGSCHEQHKERGLHGPKRPQKAWS